MTGRSRIGWRRQWQMGRRVLRVWRPRNPTRFGSHRMSGGGRVVSLRWLMLRTYRLREGES